MEQETDAVPPGTVVQEMVKAYFLNDRMVRPAAVVVAKAAKKAPAPPAAAGSSEPAKAAEPGGAQVSGGDAGGVPSGEGEARKE
jgi:hypothetical protein